MIIDINRNDTITLNELPPSLKSYQRSQLSLMGFKRPLFDKKYHLSTNELDATLLKLVHYFDGESIPYELSKQCHERITGVRDQIQDLQKLRNAALDIKQGRIGKETIAEFNRSIHGIISRKLKPHQVSAAYHFYILKNAANFSVPGSGKTAVVLSVYEKLRRDGLVNLLFVVGPPSCFGPWRKEFELTLGRSPNFRVLAGANQALRQKEYYATKNDLADLYLTTYQTLLNDQNDVKNLFESSAAKVFLVIDEAHYMKRIQGNWATAVLWLAKFAKIRCVLTGTPVPKSYTDIFNIFDFLWPTNLALAESVKVQVKHFEDENKASEAKDLLRGQVGPLFYRVKKIDLGLTPPVFHDPYLIEMNNVERSIYDAIDRRIRSYAQEDYLKNIDVVRRLRRGRIIRLRQCISYARLLSESIEGYSEELVKESNIAKSIINYDELEEPGKVTFLIKFLKKFRDERKKVVIWGHFVKTLEFLKEKLEKQNLRCDLIYGKTPIEVEAYTDERTREKIRNEFVDPESGLDILLANPAACAESISLHKTCHNAIYYDLSYNCAQYLQSLDRIHRVGGSETVEAHYHFLQYRDTIEDDIKFNLDRKSQKMYELIDEDLAVYSLDMFEGDDDENAFERIYGETARRI